MNGMKLYKLIVGCLDGDFDDDMVLVVRELLIEKIQRAEYLEQGLEDMRRIDELERELETLQHLSMALLKAEKSGASSTDTKQAAADLRVYFGTEVDSQRE